MAERDVGAFLKLAEREVIVVSPGDPRIAKWKARNWPICQILTSQAALKREFPLVIPRTPYHYFSSLLRSLPGRPHKARQLLVIVDNPEEDRQQIYREAALGMMDNPIYR